MQILKQATWSGVQTEGCFHLTNAADTATLRTDQVLTDLSHRWAMVQRIQTYSSPKQNSMHVAFEWEKSAVEGTGD